MIEMKLWSALVGSVWGVLLPLANTTTHSITSDQDEEDTIGGSGSGNLRPGFVVIIRQDLLL